MLAKWLNLFPTFEILYGFGYYNLNTVEFDIKLNNRGWTITAFLCICEIISSDYRLKSLNLTKFNGLNTSSLFDGLNTSSIDFGPSDDHWEDAYSNDLSNVTKVRMGILFIFMVLGIPSNVIILAVSIINKRKQPNSAYLLMNMAKVSNQNCELSSLLYSLYNLYTVRSTFEYKTIYFGLRMANTRDKSLISCCWYIYLAQYFDQIEKWI